MEVYRMVFIIKNDGMRYQYKDKELYTLFFKNSPFIVNHSNNKNFKKLIKIQI